MHRHAVIHGASVPLAAFLALLAGCAALPDRPAADAMREESVFFENKTGKYEKAATIFSQPSDGRIVLFSRSAEAEGIVVCVDRPLGGASAPAEAQSALELIRIAFFQNCIARANGFIGRQEFIKSHESLINAVSGSAGGAKVSK